MFYLTAKKPGVFDYYGHSYDLEPITYPNVNIRNILVIGPLLNRVVCDKNPDTMQGITFEAERLPGYPRKLDMPLEEIPDGSRLILLRGGGIGDVIMLTPALKKLREILKDRVEIILSTFAERIPLLEELGYVDRFYPYPIRLSDFIRDADYYEDFSDPKKIFNSTDMADFHLDCLSIEPSRIPAPEKIPEISPGLSMSEKVRESLQSVCKDGGTRVLFAGKASDMIRHLPPEVLTLLAGLYPDMTFIIPSDTTRKYPEGNNIYTIDTTGGLTDYVSAIGCCDILVSTDSSAYHIAAAMRKPSLVFFGSIPSAIRTNYYPLVIALDSIYKGLTCHAPCGISALQETPPSFPIGANRITDLKDGVEITTFTGETFVFDPKLGCPEANAKKSPYSPCLTSFSRETIQEGFEKVLDILAGNSSAG